MGQKNSTTAKKSKSVKKRTTAKKKTAIIDPAEATVLRELHELLPVHRIDKGIKYKCADGHVIFLKIIGPNSCLRGSKERTSFKMALPPSIGRLTHLKELMLYGTGLLSFPREIGNLKKLEGLSVDNHCLATLPGSFRKLTSLWSLSLECPFYYRDKDKKTPSRFRSLPEFICEMKSLRWLDLNGNLLESLPRSFSKLEWLTGLDLECNLLTELPGSLLTLPLRYFAAGYNPLNSLSRQIAEVIYRWNGEYICPPSEEKLLRRNLTRYKQEKLARDEKKAILKKKGEYDRKWHMVDAPLERFDPANFSR